MASKKISMLSKRIQREFRSNGDKEKAEYMANYMRKSPPTLYHGLQSPERRALQKRVMEDTGLTIDSRSEYESCILALWKLPYREEKHFGIDIALQHKKYMVYESLGLYERMLRDECCWWDFCDPIATSMVGKVALDEWDRVEPILQQWIQDDNRWIRRTAILAQLKHKMRTRTSVLFDFCEQRMHEKEFFIRKAIGWALREHGKTNPEVVIKFLKKHKKELSPLSYKEGARILIKEGKMKG